MLTLLQNYLFTGVTGNAAYDIVVKFWRQTFGKDLQDLFLDAFEQVLDAQRSTLRRYGEPAELDRETLRRALRGDLDVNRASWSDLNQDEFVQLLAQEMREWQALTIGEHNLSADEYQGLLRRLIQGAIANLRRKVLENETAFNHVLLAETAGNREQLQAVRDYLAQRLDLYLQKLEIIEAQTRPIPEILDHVQAQGKLLRQVADDVQTLRVPARASHSPPAPPLGGEPGRPPETGDAHPAADPPPAVRVRIHPDRPPIAAIRDLLLAAFTPTDLRRFCQNRPTFRPLVAKFSPGHGLDDMVDRVIDYCRTQLLWDELLIEMAQVAPRQYARFEPRLTGG